MRRTFDAADQRPAAEAPCARNLRAREFKNLALGHGFSGVRQIGMFEILDTGALMLSSHLNESPNISV